jgi:hypothetical protein
MKNGMVGWAGGQIRTWFLHWWLQATCKVLGNTTHSLGRIGWWWNGRCHEADIWVARRAQTWYGLFARAREIHNETRLICCKNAYITWHDEEGCVPKNLFRISIDALLSNQSNPIQSTGIGDPGLFWFFERLKALPSLLLVYFLSNV